VVKIAYLDCSTGISGDMTLAALIDAGVDAEKIREGISSLNLTGVELITVTVLKGAFRATYVRVEHPEQHAHRHLGDIVQLINDAEKISQPQKTLALRIFQAVAEAEAHVHGSSIEKVHFHEVGAIDSIVDIVGAAIGFDLLGVDQVLCSPVPTGRGQIRIDHGICTVPAPGTAEILKGIPLADVPIDAELTTPTGAAIVRTLVDRFTSLPAMTIEKIGYGAGTMDFPQRANLLRIFVGTESSVVGADQVSLLETNLDDITGEVLGFTKQKLIEAGALDVFSTPIQMKKDRPGVVLSTICKPDDADALQAIIFQETGTFGIRRQIIQRAVRQRKPHTVETVWGPVAGKLGWLGCEQPIFTPEFESCSQIAEQNSVPLHDVYRAAESSFLQNPIEQPTNTIHDHDHDHDHDHG